jgi:queuine tRNA-ribosyltransferase
MFNFKIEKQLENALGRAGEFTTPHGVIKTPSFVVVGTKATVKALIPEQVKDLGAQVMLANTYHLYLQPGDELIKEAGGLHKFMNWNGPIMTDSGGFQVFSLGAAYGKGISKVVSITDPNLLITERSSVLDGLPKLAKIGQDGVSFKSHIDGSLHYITPEKSIEIQHNLGADIIFAFDECTSPVEDKKYQEEALSRTHVWAKRSLEEHLKLEKKYSRSLHPQALFGIIQGGRSKELRQKSAKIISEMKINDQGFDGYGIGGSFAKEDMSQAVKWVNEILPEEKPRHLLGIGEPEDLFMGVENGVDLFDCVGPTRLGRNGTLFTKYGKINILNAKYINDFNPIDEGCGCYVCMSHQGENESGSNYTRAYLSHLFRSKEMLGATLATIHNVYFINKLVSDMRQAILDENFQEFKKEFLSKYLK